MKIVNMIEQRVREMNNLLRDYDKYKSTGCDLTWTTCDTCKMNDIGTSPLRCRFCGSVLPAHGTVYE